MREAQLNRSRSIPTFATIRWMKSRKTYPAAASLCGSVSPKATATPSR